MQTCLPAKNVDWTNSEMRQKEVSRDDNYICKSGTESMSQNGIWSTLIYFMIIEIIL